jgi:predicted transporter
MKPELCSLCLGLGFSTGIFAFKSAIGQYYYLTLQKRRIDKLLFISLSLMAYSALFLGSFYLINNFEAFKCAEYFQNFLKAGMSIHIIVAVGLLAWGIYLIKAERSIAFQLEKKSKAWLLLAIPCPVCASAIFLACALMMSLFPEMKLETTLFALLFFIAVNLSVTAGLLLYERKFSCAPESITGRMMIFTALYFFIIIVLLPNFQNIERIYRLSTGNGKTVSADFKLIGVIIALCVIFIAGFISGITRKRGKINGCICAD